MLLRWLVFLQVLVLLPPIYTAQLGRKIYFIMYVSMHDFTPGLPLFLKDGNVNVFAFSALHSALQVQSDGASSGSMRIQIRYTVSAEQPYRYYVEAKEVEPWFIKIPIDDLSGVNFKRVIELDQTTSLSNEDLFASDGSGLVASVWAQDPVYQYGTNDCNSFARNMVRALGARLPPAIDDFYKTLQQRISTTPRQAPLKTYDRVPIRHQYPAKDVASSSASYDADDFLVSKGANGQVIVKSWDRLPALTPADSEEAVELPQELLTYYKSIKEMPGANWESVGRSDSYDIPDGSNMDDQGSGCLGRRRQICNSQGEKLVGSSSIDELILSRNNGILRAVVSYGSATLDSIGVGSLVAAAAFVILDFINSQFEAASLGLASIALAATSLIVGGPLSIITAGLSALFAILPTIFEAKDPPRSNSPMQNIVQWSFFGDTRHTGNEACNEARVKSHLTPNCTIVYGAGVIAKVFDWDIFDAVAFLIVFNSGYAMSIPEIAATLNMTDHTQSNGQKSLVTVDCGVYRSPIPNRYHPSPPDPDPPSAAYPCGGPKYALNRTQAVLPVLNVTVASVYPRVIPATNGDCKLVSDPVNGVQVDMFNLTITGRPVAIACNLTGDLAGFAIDPFPTIDNMSANTSAFSNTTHGGLPDSISSHSSNETFVSAPNTTTDGSIGRAYVSPPEPPIPFTLLNSSNSICLSGNDQNICLPNGTYTTQDGGWGFSTKFMTALSMPAGSVLNFSMPLWAADNGCDRCTGTGFAEATTPKQFSSNFTSSTNSALSKDLSNSITLISGTEGYSRIEIQTPFKLIPPAICLFSDVSYQGNVGCWGVGGGNLTSPFAAKAKSMRVIGGASAWIYPRTYGDLGAAYVSTDVDDLTQLPYGTTGNFNMQIRALWVEVPAL